MSEKIFEKRLCAEVKKLGGFALKFWPISVAGFPDRIVLLPGAKIYFVELKSTGKTLDPLQKIWFRKLRGLGFHCFRVDCHQALNNFLEFAKC